MVPHFYHGRAMERTGGIGYLVARKGLSSRRGPK
jgi:hypothetical protein